MNKYQDLLDSHMEYGQNGEPIPPLTEEVKQEKSERKSQSAAKPYEAKARLVPFLKNF